MPRSSRNPYHGGAPARVRAAAWAGILCPPAVSAVLLAAGWLSPGYNPLRTTVSHLGQRGAPYALEVNVSFAALGLTMVAVAWALGRSLGRSAVAPALAVAGVALVGVAVISRDPAHPVAHRAVALAFFLTLAATPLLAAGRLRRDPAWAGHATLSLAIAGVSLALLLIGLAGVVHGGLPAGAWERGFAAVNLLWLVAVAARLRAGAVPA